ncbi:60S ribosomal protein L26 [Saguinus oedipus]|uniref:60S ribosomal protein L26 n=1 Tax=Saguinus oedipus TaxID=9490 RepID=A0ABQ9W495_SAGOE|nr:60S ribosomal protein L26 [Saguinus oedipus]
MKPFPFADITEAEVANIKFNPSVSSDQSKNNKRHSNAPFHIRRKMMSSSLSKELRQKYNIPSMPTQKNNEAQIVGGHYKRQQLGSTLFGFTERNVIYSEWVQWERLMAQLSM